MTEQPSGRLYFVVTKHWPRIAVVSVMAIGLVELIVGGITANSALEKYLVVWAATTGGLWFLFEKAEKALSDESRARVVAWIGAQRVGSSIRSLPDQFATLFDQVFGERHLTVQCAFRSLLASVVTVAVFSLLVPEPSASYFDGALLQAITFFIASMVLVAAVGGTITYVGDWASLRPKPQHRWFRLLGPYVLPWTGFFILSTLWVMRDSVVLYTTLGSESEIWIKVTTWTGVVAVGALFNFLPDYLSLLQTRWAIRFMRGGGRAWVILADLVLTAAISLGSLWIFFAYMASAGYPPRNIELTSITSVFWGVVSAEGGVIGWERVYFFSAFFTSVWLWLYAASVLLSRLLLRMNSGVGFLLRVTDVEKQPFRSMGFVSVIITSVIFALGLPLVLL